jgi:hypothetical protein
VPLVTVTQISQLLYAAAVGRKLAGRAPRTSVDFSLFTNKTVLAELNPIFGVVGDPLDGIFRLPGGAPPPGTLASDAPRANPGPTGPQVDPNRAGRITDLKALIDSNQFADHQSWQRVLTGALELKLISPLVATASQITVAGVALSATTANGAATATAAVAEIDGNFCAVLTTDCYRKAAGLTVQKVENIASPLNWNQLNSFFCEMDKLAPDAQGASQLLEHVSTEKDVYQLKTALKYWIEDFQGGGIINYELADARVGTGDSLLTLIDNGYIHIFDDGVDTVRIRTSKVVAIEGCSVTATTMLIQTIGWASMGDSMFFDNALAPMSGTFQPWRPNPEVGSAQPAGAPQAPVAPAPPANTTGMLVAESARAWADLVKATANATTAVVNKWYQGQLTIGDVAAFTTELGGRLASEPWRFLNELSARVPPTPFSPSSPQNTPGSTNRGGSP